MLQRGKVVLENLHGASGASQYVALGETEEAQQLLGCRALAEALLRIKWEFLQPLALHSPPQLTLNERLHEEREEVYAEERLDP